MIDDKFYIINIKYFTFDRPITYINHFFYHRCTVNLIHTYWVIPFITFISTILTSFWIVTQSNQFLPLRDIGLRQETLLTYFTTGLSCSKALHIHWTYLAFNWTANGADSDKTAINLQSVYIPYYLQWYGNENGNVSTDAYME